MSAEAWVFEDVYKAPGLSVRVWVRYTGPGWEDSNDPPSTCLGDVPPEHLDIWNFLGLPADGDPHADWDTLQDRAQQFVRGNERSIIEDLRASRSPTQWYWDT